MHPLPLPELSIDRHLGTAHFLRDGSQPGLLIILDAVFSSINCGALFASGDFGAYLPIPPCSAVTTICRWTQ